MSLILYFHPLSSFCMKALIGLYELDVPFTKRVVDLGDRADREAFLAVWPMGKFPVLRDEVRGITVVESSIVLEYVEQYSGKTGALVPSDRDAARECRTRDHFFDLYVNVPVGKVVGDKLRPVDKRDAYGVEQAKVQLETAYGVADGWLRGGPWAAGSDFTMADCAAAPALFYANKILPFGDRHRYLAEYLERVSQRPSFARTLDEAKPYFDLFPG